MDDPIVPGRVAIVTGGAGDIGRGVCRALTKADTAVVVLDVDVSQADGAAQVIECDVTDPAACAAAVDETVGAFGGIDTLVNMAQAYRTWTPLLKTTYSEVLSAFDSGPAATLRMMQLCHPHMKARGGGSIVNFASSAGTQGIPGMGAYAAAKEAIRGITKVAAQEWGPDNIRVNVICPFASSDSAHRFETGAWPKGILDSIPLRRAGDPETDIGATVVFLAGPGTFITGRTLQVDGGSGSWR
jgi:NAD(P)-dependent dehydrogenase (short-subunit alcohol dehydrogenase family)